MAPRQGLSDLPLAVIFAIGVIPLVATAQSANDTLGAGVRREMTAAAPT